MSVHTVRVPGDGSIVDIQGLELAEDRVTVLFGPNGAGKTTILRALAGIDGGQPGLECHYQPQRPYLFRGLAGWNMGLGLGPEEAARAAQMATALGVDHLLSRPADGLSGGETQRIALARALAKNAPSILLDEPLAAVDHADKQLVLGQIASSLEGRRAVVVTHDLGVAAALADDIAVIDGGRLLQQGPIEEVLPAPISLDVARILGVQNIIPGLATPGDGLTTVRTETIEVVGTGSVEGTARAVFPGEAVSVSTARGGAQSARNRWRGSVVELKELGGLVEVVVDVGTSVVAVVTPGAMGELELTPGLEVLIAVKASAVTVIPA